jgi:glycosyltransferase involved in cell wall biosynthesis
MHVDDVSIVITCFNREELVTSAILSSFNEFPDAQIVIVDDCSVDCSKQRINAAFNDEIANGRISLVEHQSNRGVTAAKNTGYQNADGKWVLFLDSDDLMIDGCGAAVRNALKSNEHAPAVFFRCLDRLGKPVGKVLRKSELVGLQDFLIHTSRGEVLTAVNKALVAPMLPYYSCLRGYEGLGICRILERYGPAVNTTIYARIYNSGSSQNLSAPRNVLARAHLLEFGHRVLMSRFADLMPPTVIFAYRVRVLVYYVMSIANLLISRSVHATRFSKSAY